jgi:hypothetical protein
MIESTAIYRFVVSMISDFANPLFWNAALTAASQAAAINHALSTGSTVGARQFNFTHFGLPDEVYQLVSAPSPHVKRNRHRAGRCCCHQGQGAEQ